MRLCCYTEQRFVITEVRNEIHSLQIFHMECKDCIYTSITSRSRDCGINVHREASFNVTWYTINTSVADAMTSQFSSRKKSKRIESAYDKHISCGCDDVTVLLSPEKRAHRVRLRHIHVKRQKLIHTCHSTRHINLVIRRPELTPEIMSHIFQTIHSIWKRAGCKLSCGRQMLLY